MSDSFIKYKQLTLKGYQNYRRKINFKPDPAEDYRAMIKPLQFSSDASQAHSTVIQTELNDNPQIKRTRTQPFQQFQSKQMYLSGRHQLKTKYFKSGANKSLLQGQSRTRNKSLSLVQLSKVGQKIKPMKIEDKFNNLVSSVDILCRKLSINKKQLSILNKYNVKKKNELNIPVYVGQMTRKSYQNDKQIMSMCMDDCKKQYNFNIGPSSKLKIVEVGKYVEPQIITKKIQNFIDKKNRTTEQLKKKNNIL